MFFKEQYGTLRIFKAGIHYSPVNTVEVGNLKKEIAYHGDIVNVASSIQDQYKTFDAELMISEEVYLRLKNPGTYTLQAIGDILLKGRSVPSVLYSLIK